MVLSFQYNLLLALKNINYIEYQQFPLHEAETERTYTNSDDLIERYGKIKWDIIDLINQRYSHLLKDKFDLYNWLNKNQNDELSYFLNEAGSNCLNYSQYKVPSKFHLWLGKEGFIVGIEQKGQGFNPQNIWQKKLKENEGAGFSFFEKCKNKIFFDDKEEARMVLIEFNLTS